MADLGFLDDPGDRLGMLDAQRMRAARVVARHRRAPGPAGPAAVGRRHLGRRRRRGRSCWPTSTCPRRSSASSSTGTSAGRARRRRTRSASACGSRRATPATAAAARGPRRDLRRQGVPRPGAGPRLGCGLGRCLRGRRCGAIAAPARSASGVPAGAPAPRSLRASGIDPQVGSPASTRTPCSPTRRASASATLEPADAVLVLAQAKAEEVRRPLDAAWPTPGDRARPDAGSRRTPRPRRPARARAATRCSSSTARSSASRPTPTTAAARWRAMRGRSGVLHTGHWVVDLRDAGRPAAPGGTLGATLDHRRALRRPVATPRSTPTSRPASRSPSRARSPSTAGAARSSPASRATTTASSASACRCCASCSARSGVRVPDLWSVVAVTTTPAPHAGPCGRPRGTSSVGIPTNGSGRPWALPNLRRRRCAPVRAARTPGVTVSRARHLQGPHRQPRRDRRPHRPRLRRRRRSPPSPSTPTPTARPCTSASPTRRSRSAAPARPTPTSTRQAARRRPPLRRRRRAPRATASSRRTPSSRRP